ncbi:MATE family efflux transporter [Bacillus massiliigorillae]|uniref:MATE family efflux transporter n=1 Tax=Bacillus massiliigorillae TaxID=1243664 RepID=UPI00039F9AFF|nr:MATE family efflux transporter [Bacillus massiliigorillae]
MSVKNKQQLTLFALTWPLFIEFFLHMLMGNADTLMLSLYSDNSVAAVGVSNQILSLVIVMFGFIATGTAILVAQNLGAKNTLAAAEISVISIVTNLAFGLILSVAVFFSSRSLLHLMDLPNELMGEADSYLSLVGGFSFVQALIMTAGAILRSYGFTKDAMFVTIGMNLLNIIGNYLFIFGPFGIPVLGVEGVAISTTVSRIIGLVIIMVLLIKRVPQKLEFFKVLKMPYIHLKNLLAIGIPSAGEQLSYNGSQMVITYFITMLGTEALTTRVYASNLMMFIYLFAIAIAQGTQILIGHDMGARRFDDAYKRCLRSLRLGILASLLCALVFATFSKPLLSIFTNNSEILIAGSMLLWLTVILEPGRAFNIVIINSLKATGDVKYPVIIGILSMWGVSVTLSYFLGIHLGWGLIGIWIAFAVDEWLRGILMLRRWQSKAWMKKSFVFTTSEESTKQSA